MGKTPGGDSKPINYNDDQLSKSTLNQSTTQDQFRDIEDYLEGLEPMNVGLLYV
jgi:hypothetical protein